MRSKTEAQEKLAALPLLRPVVVLDPGESDGDMAGDLRPGPGRRAYRFEVPPPGRGVTTIEIDAIPTPQQLEDLARHLPVAEKDRQAAREVITRAAESVTRER